MPNADVLDIGVLEAPNAGWDDAPKGAEKPNMLLPNASCDGWVAPNDTVWVEADSEPPKEAADQKLMILESKKINSQIELENWQLT